MKQAPWPIPRKFKLAFLEIKIEDESLKKVRWELLEERYKIGDFKNIDSNDQEALKEKMKQIVYAADRNEERRKEIDAIKQKSEIELAELFVEKVNDVFKADDEIKKETVKKMADTFSKDVLYLFVHFATNYYKEREWQEHYKSLLTGLNNIMKPKP